MIPIEKKKTGRPTDEPKNIVKRARMSETDVKKLQLCSEVLGISESDVLRMGIDEVMKMNKISIAKRG